MTYHSSRPLGFSSIFFLLLAANVLRLENMQVFRDSNGNCRWLPSAFPSLLHSIHRSPPSSRTKNSPTHFRHSNNLSDHLTSPFPPIPITLFMINSEEKNICTTFLQVALTLNSSAAAAAAAIVYLAHNGNSNTNWLAICQQFGDFCQQVSGAVVAAFVSVVVFMFLILLSALSIRRS